MATLTDKLLSMVDHLTRQGGPLNVLIDTLVSRIAPATTAQACGGNFFCGTTCGFASNCFSTADDGTFALYAATPPQCDVGPYTRCFAHCGC